jgi:CheY-like chemotaxis protein
MLAHRSALSSPLRHDSPLARRLAQTPFLVIDDSPFVRRMVREILHSFSARVVADAADGFQGLVEARRQPPKVIILDWFMPGFSGLEFLHVLRDSRRSPAPHADVLIITGKPTLKLVTEAQKFGVGAIIRKPFAPKALLDRLAHPTLRFNQPEPEKPPLAIAKLLTRHLPRVSPHLFGDEVGKPGAKVAENADPLASFSLDDETWAI